MARRRRYNLTADEFIEWQLCPRCGEPSTTKDLIKFNGIEYASSLQTCPVCKEQSKAEDWQVGPHQNGFAE